VTSKIAVNGSMIVMHGDEMAQVAFEQLLEIFVKKRVSINLEEFDLSAENRLLTNGAVVEESIEALKRVGVGVKNAGMTLNAQQLEGLLSKHQIAAQSLTRMATASPNGTIRKGMGGNITREDIKFVNIKLSPPDWIGRDIEVVTMDSGGNKYSHNELSTVTGTAKVLFTGSSGEPVELHRRTLRRGDPWMLASNSVVEVVRWARQFFERALDESKDVYVGLKDTVIPGYDGVMKAAVTEIFEQEFAQRFKERGLGYTYGLIDAQAASIIANPPEHALWGVPDNSTGRRLYKLVETLKEFGIPARKFHISISRMSAGGGDQYGSFNMAAREDGIVKIVVDGEEKHAREVSEGDPLLFMSNDREAIKDWVYQVFRDASLKDKEVYFGLKREYFEYDDVFSDVINDVREELVANNTEPPSFMIMRPSNQLIKMISDPPRNALYPAQNLDGDIFSDIAAALGGSLATASSIIESREGTLLFEAPHGTAHDLYLKYLESDGMQKSFNPSALIYAISNALEEVADKEDNSLLHDYSQNLKRALIKTVADGIITGDLKGKTTDLASEQIVDMDGFINAVEIRL
jgi:isocitrate dehydrogenase